MLAQIGLGYLHPLVIFAYPRGIQKGDDPSFFKSLDFGVCQPQLQSLGLYYSTGASWWTQQTICTCFAMWFTRCLQSFTAGTAGTFPR